MPDHAPSTASTPELSVVIASHNRSARLRRCLEALCGQSLDPARFEVVVADDGSPDGTAEMAEAIEVPFALSVLRLDKGGKSRALNAGIEAATAPVCLFIDDDVVASEQLVAEHLRAHAAAAETLGIGPLTQPAPPDGNWYGRAHAAAWNQRYDDLESKIVDWRDCYGGNFSAPRQALLEVGGFATEISAIEDIELGYRLVAIGCVPAYLPRARAVHEDQKPLARLVADVEGYGGFCAEFAEREPPVRPQLIGWFLSPTPREVTLRRTLLALRTPPSLLARLGAALPGASRKQLWFGFVSRYAFWRGVRGAMGRRRWLQTTRGVPVLMYHAFSEEEERDRFVVSRRSFERQLRLLARLGYRAIRLEDLVETLRRGEAPPPRSVVVSIDDGYRDNLDVALPALRRRGVPATVFLVSKRLGESNDWTAEGALAGRPLMTPEEAAELAAAGVAIGAHTRTHPSLPATAAEQLPREVGGSAEDLASLLGQPVTAFAYPYGELDQRAADAVAAAGLAGACTVEPRPARLGEDPLRIPRIEVHGTDPLRRFLRRLWFGGA